MNPRINPYAPGAGTTPPELTGRDAIIEKASVALHRCRGGLAARGLLLVGLRGVGKTVLLNRMALDAEVAGLAVVSLEAPEKRSLPALLAPALRAAMLRLDRFAAAGKLGKRALRVLGSFVTAMKVKYQDVEFAVDLGGEPGTADSGDLEHDLTDLFIEMGHAAKEKKTALGLFIDEIQYVEESQFAVLIMALHKCTQLQLPIMLLGAGLPHLIGQAGRAKSYAERLFEYQEIGPLDELSAREALAAPAEKLGVKYQKRALQDIMVQTRCYPYFLQEWGKHSWHCAKKSPITRNDVAFATDLAISELDAGFFRVRFDRLTPGEKKYLRAMAELGSGTHRSGDIARLLNKEVRAVAPTRASLIGKGMIFSLSHGDNGYTVPLFENYMKRVMPDING